MQPTVKVLYFGSLAGAMGVKESVEPIPADGTVAGLLAALSARHGAVGKAAPSLAVAVNLEYSRRDARLSAGDEVALIPPVSGG